MSVNRRGFLTQLFQGAIIGAATPQIVTHGLKLWTPKTTVTKIATKIVIDDCIVEELPPYWILKSMEAELRNVRSPLDE